MGKLKEKWLNNLTPEEMDEHLENLDSEYLNYMEKYKNLFDDNGNPMPEDVINQIGEEQKKLEQEFYEQEVINLLNESNKLKYTDNDILNVLERYIVDQKMIDLIVSELNDGWNIKNGYSE